MLAELVDHVIGVDPDRDWITVAVVDAHTTGIDADGRFPATTSGYADAVEFVGKYSAEADRAWAIEGTASYGRGLTVALAERGEWVIEADHPTRKTKDGAKSDHLDAVRAAREVLGREHLNAPRAHDGLREAIRVVHVTRASAVRARTAAINELKALILTAHETIRSQLRGLSTNAQIARCAKFRDLRAADTPIELRSTRNAMRTLARRINHHDTEIADHDRELQALTLKACPQLIAESGIGNVTAAQFYIAWSHPGRCRSEAAFARLAGTAPIEATSGQNQTRHRLSRGGDRQLNCALHQVILTRRRCDPATQAYIARRTAEGLSTRYAMRCLKRYLARHIWRLLEHPPITA